MPSAKNLTRAKTFAVIAVMILLAGAIPVLIPGSSEGYSGDQHTVRYHLYQTKPSVSTGDNEDTGAQGTTYVDVKYKGSVVSTEYNPQVWAGTFTDSDGEPYDQNWYPIISYREYRTLVFTGWVYADGTGYTDSRYPGEVLSEGEMEAATGSDGLIHVYATWGTLANYSNGLTYSFTGGNEYTNIIVLGSGTYRLDQLNYDSWWASPGLTIRGGGNTTLYLYGNNGYGLNQNTIIDSVRISGNFTRNHGDEGAGLYANGHVLIVGTGVNTAPTNITESGYPETAYPQVVGGSNGGTAGLGLERTPLGESSAVSLGTLLILHSGTYGNVVAGSRGGSVSGSTYVVLREVQVLDTLVGACSSSGSVSGSTYVYATSLEMAGDHYEETFLGNDPAVDDIMESTVITGGSNNGQVNGDTHLFISGDSEVWDVQGAGRRGESTVSGTASVEVSGEALVKHVVCGSITDGLGYTGNGSPGHNTKCVDSTEIRIKDSAAAGSVFGGGYDTFYQALYVSMMDGGNISISLEDDCTVGYVYGGGYRGTVGTQSQPIDSVSIEISGGTVLGHVFGGGRGGLDKMTHLSNGDYRWSESEQDTTGFSEIYAEHISISVSGGVVQGNVYGGGESVPIITAYNGKANLDGGHSLGGNDCTQVAAVHCSDISVEITGGTVGGDVYGSGKGVDPDDLDYYDRDGKPVDSSVSGGYSIHSSAYIFAMKKDTSGVYGIAKIPWVSGVGGTVLQTNANYSDFALADTGVVTVSIGNAEIGGSVYGGGEYGRLGPVAGTGGTVEVTVGSGARVNGDVIAGGYGQSGVLSTNTVSKSVVINGSTISGDVYGGSRFGDDNIGTTSMAQGDTVIRLVSGSVGGSVYGGGYQGGSNSNVTFDIGAPAVTNDISPAGYEVTISGSVYGGGYQGSVLGNVSIDIAGIGSVTISDSVYGGGYLGTVGPMGGSSNYTLVMNIGVNVIIGGSVYGGGYGESNMLSTNVLTRTVTVNGSTIRGSVYGGSRFGDDNCTESGGNILTNGSAILYIISGDIAAGSSGNVYGGGYRGYSAMDTYVYVGVPAAEESRENLLSDTLRIESVYGGSSVGESSDYLSDAELLIGDARVTIGNLDPDTRGSPYVNFSITGDVFGEGDYCAITGESYVTFTAFEQDGSMLSVQKADILDVIGSSLVLDGNVDGSDTQASERLSMNLIGDLRLQRLNGEISSLDMKAAASQIGGYGSLDESGDPIVYSETDTKLNTITLRDGMMMSILGEGNNGLSGEMNEIRGFTILDNGGDSYYGTFAMGPTDVVQNGYTGFMIKTNAGLVAAQEGHYTFHYNNGSGSTVPVAMTMWFIAGVYKVETTMVLQDDSGGGTISAQDDVMAPKTVSNSTISFVGGYVNADSQGSLNLVGSPTENPGTDFQVLVGGKGDANHIHFGNGGVAAFPDSSVQFQGSGIYLNIKVSTMSGFGTTGYAGTVTLHMVEYIGDIPINMFDVEVGIYLRVTSETQTITETIVMRAFGDSKHGTTDVYLPVLGENHMAVYTIKLLGTTGETEGTFVDISGTLTLETVATNLNKNGWQSTEHTGEMVPVWNKDTPLGVGGVFAPVIGFSYTADEPFEEIHFELTIQDENGGNPKVYIIILEPELAEYVELSFYDKYLIYDDDDDSISWSQWTQGDDGEYLDPVFILKLQFGMQLDTLRVAVSESFLNGKIGSTAIQDLEADKYIEVVREAISATSSTEAWFGDILLLQSDSENPATTVLCGDESYVNGILSDQALQDEYEVMSVEEFLNLYISLKPGTDYKDGDVQRTFDYSDHYSWYDTHECITEFRFSSSISNDLDVFAGYTITVTVVPFTDKDDPDAANKEYTVTPSTRMIVPGEEVDLGNILGSLTITRGYGAVDSGMWFSMDSSALREIGTNSDGRHVITPRVDTVVYLMLERESYGITLVIDGEEQMFQSDYEVSVTQCVENTEHSTSAAHFGDSVEVMFTWRDGYHIGSISGTTQLGVFPGLSHERTDGDGTDMYTISFEMPSSALTISIILTDKRSVTVELADGTETSDSDRFGLGDITDSGSSMSIVLSDTLSTKSRTTTTNITSASIDVITDLGTGVLITVLVNGQEKYEHESPSDVTLDLSQAGDEVTVTIIVNVMWSLTISGEGYDVKIGNLTYDSDRSPDYVLTGDVLTVQSKSGNSLTGIQSYGLRSNGHDGDYVWTFTVNGTGNAGLSLPVFSVVLTVDLVFMCGTSEVTLRDGWHPDGTLTVISEDGTELRAGAPTVDNMGHLVYTLTVDSGTYIVSATFGGFVSNSETLLVGSDSVDHSIILNAVEYTIHVRTTTSDSFDDTNTWYAVYRDPAGQWGYSTDTVDGTGDDDEAAAWFMSDSQDMSAASVVEGFTVITTDMFDGGTDLYFLAVPGLDGEAEETVDPMEFHAVVIAVDGEVNGTHTITTISGVANGTYSAVMADGTEVTVGYIDHLDGSAILTVSGCPAGLGGLALMCTNGDTSLNLLLYSVPDLGAVP